MKTQQAIAEAYVREKLDKMLFTIELQHWLRVLVSTEFNGAYTRAIDQDGYLMEFDPYEQISPWNRHYSNLRFDLTTGQPATEADFLAFNQITQHD